MQLKIGENTVRFTEIENEYIAEYDHSTVVHSLKYLSCPERRLMILYAELGGIRPVAKIYKCSTRTVWKEINKIKLKLKYICSKNL